MARHRSRSRSLDRRHKREARRVGGIMRTAAIKRGRKAPGISATSLAVGTKRKGVDGMYVVTPRSNGSQYWKKMVTSSTKTKTRRGRSSSSSSRKRRVPARRRSASKKTKRKTTVWEIRVLCVASGKDMRRWPWYREKFYKGVAEQFSMKSRIDPKCSDILFHVKATSLTDAKKKIRAFLKAPRAVKEGVRITRHTKFVHVNAL